MPVEIRHTLLGNLGALSVRMGELANCSERTAQVKKACITPKKVATVEGARDTGLPERPSGREQYWEMAARTAARVTCPKVNLEALTPTAVAKAGRASFMLLAYKDRVLELDPSKDSSASQALTELSTVTPAASAKGPPMPRPRRELALLRGGL